jgi:hypothetical protein
MIYGHGAGERSEACGGWCGGEDVGGLQRACRLALGAVYSAVERIEMCVSRSWLKKGRRCRSLDGVVCVMMQSADVFNSSSQRLKS